MMARPRSDEKRDALMAAAVNIIADRGLSAPTAAIALKAGVSNGSLFTYFATKSDLLNQLYVELKGEMGAAASEGMPGDGDVRAQLSHMWFGWVRWATANREKRRVLAHLEVAGEITPESRRAAGRALADVREVLERSRRDVPMQDVSPQFAAALMSALADTTIDHMIQHPSHADAHAAAAFEALWRMVA